MHISTLYCRIEHMRESEESLRKLQAKCDRELRPYDARTLYVCLSLANCYQWKGDFSAAWKASQDLITRSISGPGLRRTFFNANGLAIRAQCEYKLGQTLQAEISMRQALNLRMSRLGEMDSRASIWLLTLQEWCLKRGDHSAVAQIQNERRDVMDAFESTTGTAFPRV